MIVYQTVLIAICIGSLGILVFIGIWYSRREIFSAENGSNTGLGHNAEIQTSQLLWVEPHYGYDGWVTKQPVQTDIQPDTPEPFKMRFLKTRIFNSRNDIKGGVGKVEHPGHEFDGFWVVFVPRWSGAWDIKNQTGPFNIIVGSEEPIHNADVWDCMPTCPRVRTGFGIISVELLQAVTD